MSFDAEPVDARLIDRMCNTIIHRGPDDVGSFVNGGIGIGMRRLSIIDLKKGHQPISNEDRTIHIVFNGEIYNYKELRKDLIDKGHNFKTDSDTEVILHLYEEYSYGSLKHLNGMFAFAIWDGKENKLFCARDRLGIKPFYYYIDQRRFVFGSELKVILEVYGVERELDFGALSQYLTFEFIPYPKTLLSSIRKLPPGHFLSVSNSHMDIEQYWFPEEVEEIERSVDEAVEELHALLKDSVRLRLRSDVPFGAFLSGGIDSSTIVAYMSGLLDTRAKTFSIGFDDRSYNELDYARNVAKSFSTDHTEEILQPSVVDLIDRLVDFMDDPIGDFSIFPTYLVSKMAREKVKVILSGDGGDELFGGYETYIAQKLDRYYSKIPERVRSRLILPLVENLPPMKKKKGVINKLKRFIDGTKVSGQYNHFRWMVHMMPDEKYSIFTSDISNIVSTEESFSFIRKHLDNNRLTGLNKAMYLDIKTYLTDNILVKVDRMSMATSLEVRVPFLDHRVVEFALSLPEELKIKGLKTKHILKTMMHGVLPDTVINKPKQGFSIPMKNWLRGAAKSLMMDMLSEERLKIQGIFNPLYIKRLVEEHLYNRANHSHKLWGLILFQCWYDRFLTL